MVQLCSAQVKKFVPTLLVLSIVLLAGCASQKPLTETEQAQQYGMTIERYREEKQAAARMNHSWDEHVKMLRMEGKL
ncbi:hypothetical protein COU76_05465 [Candidatus Peregrinibacteria bacterium CG10_big_fil_rev_8_21_14_0_10_49_10]|nr:MAG: hypothetical protein COU76_05465 [Candidatus Peregrinibacteria bacterium CG10_big_fil_rev_8_21_14_0_10_49_10]